MRDRGCLGDVPRIFELHKGCCQASPRSPCSASKCGDPLKGFWGPGHQRCCSQTWDIQACGRCCGLPAMGDMQHRDPYINRVWSARMLRPASVQRTYRQRNAYRPPGSTRKPSRRECWHSSSSRGSHRKLGAHGRSKTCMPPHLCQDLLEQAWLICRRPIQGELHTGLQAAHRGCEEEGACRAASHMEATGWLGATGQVSLGPIPAAMNMCLRLSATIPLNSTSKNHSSLTSLHLVRDRLALPRRFAKRQLLGLLRKEPASVELVKYGDVAYDISEWKLLIYRQAG